MTEHNRRASHPFEPNDVHDYWIPAFHSADHCDDLPTLSPTHSSSFSLCVCVCVCVCVWERESTKSLLSLLARSPSEGLWMYSVCGLQPGSASHFKWPENLRSAWFLAAVSARLVRQTVPEMKHQEFDPWTQPICVPPQPTKADWLEICMLSKSSVRKFLQHQCEGLCSFWQIHTCWSSRVDYTLDQCMLGEAPVIIMFTSDTLASCIFCVRF